MGTTATEGIERELRELRGHVAELLAQREGTAVEIRHLREQGERVAAQLGKLLLDNERRLTAVETIVGDMQDHGTRGGETKAQAAERLRKEWLVRWAIALVAIVGGFLTRLLIGDR